MMIELNRTFPTDIITKSQPMAWFHWSLRAGKKLLRMRCYAGHPCPGKMLCMASMSGKDALQRIVFWKGDLQGIHVLERCSAEHPCPGKVFCRASIPGKVFCKASLSWEGVLQGIPVLRRCSAGHPPLGKVFCRASLPWEGVLQDRMWLPRKNNKHTRTKEKNPAMSVSCFQLMKLNSFGWQKKYIGRDYFQKASLQVWVYTREVTNGLRFTFLGDGPPYLTGKSTFIQVLYMRKEELMV